jgi:hypothetical protein
VGKVKVAAFSISVDGFGAGPGQDLGEGEHLFCGIDLPGLGYAPVKTVSGDSATHVIIKKEIQQ